MFRCLRLALGGIKKAVTIVRILVPEHVVAVTVKRIEILSLKGIRSLLDYVRVVDTVSPCPPSPVHFITLSTFVKG
jgi:hypothetical protein